MLNDLPRTSFNSLRHTLPPPTSALVGCRGPLYIPSPASHEDSALGAESKQVGTRHPSRLTGLTARCSISTCHRLNLIPQFDVHQHADTRLIVECLLLVFSRNQHDEYPEADNDLGHFGTTNGETFGMKKPVSTAHLALQKKGARTERL